MDIALRRLAAADLRDPKAVHNAINIKRIVAALRKQRPGMVQTFEQYLLCHQVLPRTRSVRQNACQQTGRVAAAAATCARAASRLISWLVP